MCWWDDPSILTPFIVMMMSPTINEDAKNRNSSVTGRQTWLCVVFVHRYVCICGWVGVCMLISDISVNLCVQLKGVIRSDSFVCVWNMCRGCGWLTCGQAGALSCAVLLHLAHKRAHLHCRAVLQLQAIGLQQEAPLVTKRALKAWQWCMLDVIDLQRTWISKPNDSLSCFSSAIVILCKREKKEEKNNILGYISIFKKTKKIQW